MRPGPLIAVLLVHAAIVLGGVFLMLVAFGNTLDRKLNEQVSRVERDLTRNFGQVREDVRKELDARIPAATRSP